MQKHKQVLCYRLIHRLVEKAAFDNIGCLYGHYVPTDLFFPFKIAYKGIFLPFIAKKKLPVRPLISPCVPLNTHSYVAIQGSRNGRTG